MRISLEPSYVLHQRAYRETSALLDVFTKDHGRISLIGRGVRKNRSSLRALLQPFSPLLLSFQGKGELMTLIHAESTGFSGRLVGDSLLAGFYLNELLMRLLPKNDPHPAIYTIYEKTLLELQRFELQQKTLRLFEKNLLKELGYELCFSHEKKGEAIQKDRYYRFFPGEGFLEASETTKTPSLFLGETLLALAEDQLEDKNILRDAKTIMRSALEFLLEGKPLHCRELFSR